VSLSRLSAVAAVLVLSVAAAGCGSDDKSATESWADGMCSALVDWQKNVAAAGEKVSKGDVTKSSLEESSNAVSDANKQFRDDLKSLGKPPTPTADKAKSELQHLSDELNANMDKVRQALQNISSPSDIATAAAAAGSAVQAMGNEVNSTSEQLKSLANDETWKNAVNSSESCKNLTG